MLVPLEREVRPAPEKDWRGVFSRTLLVLCAFRPDYIQSCFTEAVAARNTLEFAVEFARFIVQIKDAIIVDGSGKLEKENLKEIRSKKLNSFVQAI